CWTRSRRSPDRCRSTSVRRSVTSRLDPSLLAAELGGLPSSPDGEGSCAAIVQSLRTHEPIPSPVFAVRGGTPSDIALVRRAPPSGPSPSGIRRGAPKVDLVRCHHADAPYAV